MEGFDFTYKVGFEADLSNVKKKIELFQANLGAKPFDLSFSLPELNTKAVEDAYRKIANVAEEVREVTAETVTVRDKEGKSYEHVTGLIIKYVDAMLNVVTARVAVDNTIDDIVKQGKAYDEMGKSALNASKRAENMNKKHKITIQGTSAELIKNINEWKRLAETNQGNSANALVLKTNIERLNTELQKHSAEATQSSYATKSFASSLETAVKQSFVYTLAMRGIRLAQNKVRDSIRYLIDLNTELTNIRILQEDGAKTQRQVESLGDAFTQLGIKMGASTLEVSRGSVEWLRQGKSIAETQQLLMDTIRLAKLGALDTADATEKLTSIMNGYSMATEQSTDVVSKLVAVDNVAATSTNELATAMQYSSAIAKETGVTFEQLVSYIATVSETTRQGAESIGQGLKTMLSRLQDIRGGKLDEDGFGINNVEIALKRANVALRDGKYEFRDFGTVLEELASKWNTLTGVEQAYIAKSIAGVRQINMFTVLMTNMNRALELQEVQANSSGLAIDRYNLYMESLQAKIQQAKTGIEKLYKDAISTGLIEGFIKAGKVIINLIDKIGGLKTIVLALATAFTMSNATKFIGFITTAVSVVKQLIMVTEAGTLSAKKDILVKQLQAMANNEVAVTATAAAAAQKELALVTSATAMGPFMLAVVAITALVVILEKAIVTTRELSQALDESNRAISEYENKISQVQSLHRKFVELNKVLNDSNKTTEEKTNAQEELYSVNKQLVEIMPALTASFDEEGRVIAVNSEQIKSQIDLLEYKLNLEKESANLKARGILYSTKLRQTAPYGSMSTPMMTAVTIPNTKKIEKAFDSWQDAQERGLSDETIAKRLDKYLELVGIYSDAMVQLGEEDSREFIDALINPEIKKLFENLFDTEDLAESSADKAIRAYGERLTAGARDYQRRNLEEQGYGNKAIENFIMFGEGEDLFGELYSNELPQVIKDMEDFSGILDNISTKQIITEEQRETLRRLGIESEASADGLWVLTTAVGENAGVVIQSESDMRQAIMDRLQNEYIASEAVWNTIESLLEEKSALLEAERASRAHEQALRDMQAVNQSFADIVGSVTDAVQSQAETGQISIDQALALIDAGYGEAVAFDYVTNTIYANESSLRELLARKIEAQIASIDLQLQTAQENGLLIEQIQALSLNKDMWEERLKVIREGSGSLFGDFSSLGMIPRGGSGGGGRKEDPRIKENEKLIKEYEKLIDKHKDEIALHKDEIDAIKEAQKQYGKWIDEKKKSLETSKKETDYFKEQQKSLKNLADLRKQMSLLELDTSEEAEAKRMELEVKISDLTSEIAENAEDRRHELQMQALDNLKASFDEASEKQIQAIQEIIDGIEAVIEGIREQIESVREFIAEIREQSSRSGGNSLHNTQYGGGSSTGGSNVQTSANLPDAPPITTLLTNPRANELGLFVAPTIGNKITQYPNSPYTHAALPNAYDYGTWDEYANLTKTIQSMSDGLVIRNEWDKRLGNVVEILNEVGTIVRYAHLADRPENLQVGQQVTEGQVIGEMGASGPTANGVVHLHAEFYKLKEENIDLLDTLIENAEQGLGDGLTAINKQFLEYINLGYSLFHDTAYITEDAIDKYIDLTDAQNETVSDFTGAMEDGVISITEAVNLGIAEQGETISGFVIRIGNELRNFKFNKDTSTFEQYTPPTKPPVRKPHLGGNYVHHYSFHDGGLTTNKFTTALKDNEIFAKLLDNEHVSTEAQMSNFLRSTLPRLVASSPKFLKSNSKSNQNINVTIPINVEGTLDKSVIPLLKKEVTEGVFAEMNRALISQGYIRSANQTIS